MFCRSWKEVVDHAAGVYHQDMTSQEPVSNTMSCGGIAHIITTHPIERINEHLGLVSLDASSVSDLGWAAQDRLDF